MSDRDLSPSAASHSLSASSGARRASPARADLPITVLQDKTILVDVHHPRYAEARNAIARFSELVKAPEHLHTYALSPISLWNAAALGMTAEDVKIDLGRFAAHGIPQNLLVDIDTYMGRYGKIRLEPSGRADRLFVRFEDPYLEAEVVNLRNIGSWLRPLDEPGLFALETSHRGELKWELAKLGYPVEDHAGYDSGAPLDVTLRDVTTGGETFALRDYQREAVEVFHHAGSARGGHGVVVLPCGAGKTIVAMGAMAQIAQRTLILTSGTVAIHQWIRELLDKTHLQAEQIGEYSGEKKDLRPVTVTSYQVLTHRRSRTRPFTHLDRLSAEPWGLIVYDEVHLLPAPVFRFTSAIQGVRRLGLTATLVREDGREAEVFGLVGPKKYDVPWKTLEEKRFIARAYCFEIRIGMDAATRRAYRDASKRQKFRVASENPSKLVVLKKLLEEHAGDHVLVIGQYVNQLRTIARELGAPLIEGATPSAKREAWFKAFRDGRESILVVSRVANFAIDLPHANVGIQVSGTFGSRQEEAQRLGRLLRPKDRDSFFYTLVSRDSVEQDFAVRRQRFLAEQGYQYILEDRDP